MEVGWTRLWKPIQITAFLPRRRFFCCIPLKALTEQMAWLSWLAYVCTILLPLLWTISVNFQLERRARKKNKNTTVFSAGICYLWNISDLHQRLLQPFTTATPQVSTSTEIYLYVITYSCLVLEGQNQVLLQTHAWTGEEGMDPQQIKPITLIFLGYHWQELDWFNWEA